MKRDLVVFGEDWGAHPSSTQHLIYYIAQTRRVIWVNSIGLRQPRLTTYDMQRIITKCRNLCRKNSHAQPTTPLPAKLSLVNLFTLPAPQSPLARRLSAALIKHQLQPLLEQHNIQDPIFWASLPTAIDAINALDGRSIVYYCGDDFSSLAGVDHQTVTEHEQRLVAQADLILTASDKLYAKYPLPRTKLLTHGVDFELFSTQTAPALELAGHPFVAGFYGSLSEWLDYSLLCDVITARPDWCFVFIGALTAHAQQLAGFSNVKLLGAKPHAALPSYSQHWQVSMLPFLHNKQIEFCNPLKLKEYMATGRPILATRFPAVRPYQDLIYQADTAQEWVATLDAIADNIKQSSVAAENERATKRQQAVAQQTWQAKAREIDALLDRL